MGKSSLIVFLICLFPDIAFAANINENNLHYGNLLLKIIMYVILLILVLFITFYGTKFLAKRSKTFFNSKYMEVVDSINLGSNNRIVIININNYIYIISMNNNGTALIDKMEIESFYSSSRESKDFSKYLEENIERKEIANSFENELKKMLNRFKFINRKIDGNEDENEESD
ncbi:flagellar biosynthetic protein FliO [Anaerosalibacter massiliensis]|uniref:Flagellar biosynthetic protein FliO n=1 Tax=Anaerosalibacter massiliensis TaxID=1347392 RepID=A0A9X2MFK7_9FIRM|nr:flagellar biosynthetic protein FliO [Anaerosalibacter massiliensis]MCR2042759.1 flagellar biosynthetic protein FliO [Anaerosalibacter massiliensis]